MELKPKDVLQASWIQTYQDRITLLHDQLARVRSTLFVLKHVANFPFDLFGEHDGPFWNLVRQSLETTVVIGLWRLLFDSDSKSLTLRQLKNDVMAHAVDESAKRCIAERLHASAVDKRIGRLEKKITELRHKHFAHLDMSTATKETGSAASPRVTFKELDELASAAHDLINAIGMDTHYMTLDPDYDLSLTQGGKRIIPDVELMFDDMVRRCDEIRMPEDNPYEFQIYWKNLTPRRREAYNAYRKKLNLPEVPTDN